MAHPEVGHKVLQEALDLLGDAASVEREPKFEGRRLSMIVTKQKGGIKKDEQNEDKKINTKKSEDNGNRQDVKETPA